MQTQVVIKKWGNSLAVILPKELVEKQRLKQNKKVFLTVVNMADISLDFGSLKRKISGQKFKDMVRAGWER